ncbi:MAG: Gfo/Idh/MocA family oxidoreductase [Opitutaceae bacterium]
MSKLKCVLVGTGSIANSHVNAARSEADRLDLVAAMDVDREKGKAFCERFDIGRCHDDFDAMLAAEKPDLVQIAVPPKFHCELAIRSLEAGAWVLCEKPLCASLAELDRIEDAERRTGRYCASVFQMRYAPSNRHIKAVIDSGLLGRPLVGICNTVWYRDHGYYEVPWRGTWKSELGGPTMGHGIHAMDQFLELMGEWTEVHAMAGTLDRRIEVEDTSMAIVRFSNGAMGSIINSILCPREESYLRLDLQKATIELSHLYAFSKSNWRITPAPGQAESEGMTALNRWPEDAPVSHGIQLGAILDDREAGRRPLTSGPGARELIDFISSLYKSVFTGGSVGRRSIVPGDPFYDGMNGGRTRLPGATA